MAVKLQLYSQRTTAQGSVTPLFRGSNAASLGGAIASAGNQVAAGVREHEQEVERQQQQDAATTALRVTAEARTKFATRLTEMQEQGEAGLPGFTAAVSGEYQQFMESTLAGVPDFARQRVKNSLLMYGDTLSQTSIGIETKARWTKRADDLQTGIDGAVNFVSMQPGSYASTKAELEGQINDSQLPPAMRAAALENVNKQLPVAYAMGLSESNPGAVLGSFNRDGSSKDPVINSLPVNKRLQIKAHANQLVETRMSNARADLKIRMQDEVATILAGNEPKTSVSREAVIAAYGPAKGALAWEAFQQDVQTSQLVVSVGGMPKHEQQLVVKALRERVDTAGEFDQLRKVEQAIERANAEKNRAASEERQTLSLDYLDAMDGNGPMPGMEQYSAAYPDDPREAERRYKADKAALDTMAFIRDAADDPTGEAAQKAVDATQGGGALNAQTRNKMIAAVEDNDKKREDSPADAILSYNKLAQKAWESYAESMSSGDAESRRFNAQRYVGIVDAERQRLGIDNPNRLPKAFVEGVAVQIGRMMAPEGNAQSAVDFVQQLKSDFGDEWPRISRELMDKALPEVLIPVAAGMKEAPARRLMDARNTKATSLVDKQGELKVLTDAVANEMAAYRPSMNSGLGIRGAGDTYAVFSSAVDKLAAVYYAEDSIPADTAAKRAFNDVLGHRYEFVGSIRIPKELASDRTAITSIVRGLDFYKENVAPDELKATDAAKTPKARKILANSLVWATTPNDEGVVLVERERGVITDANDIPITLTWEEAKQAATMRGMR